VAFLAVLARPAWRVTLTSAFDAAARY